MISVKMLLIRVAVSRSSERFTITIPPKGASVSVAKAFVYASANFSPLPMPQGLQCFTIMAVGSLKRRMALKAESISIILLKDNSLPCKTSQAALVFV